MAKFHLRPEAERLYVVEQQTLAEIASRLAVSERTLRDWKAQEDWERKRHGYVSSRQSFDEELCEFARSLMGSLRRDLDAEREVSQARLYALVRILPLLSKVKEYEDMKAVTPPAGSKDPALEDRPFTPEDLATLLQEHLGG